MSQTFIWKPSTINSWKKGVAFLAPDSTDRSQAPTITAGGKTYTGKYINTNEGRHQWVFPSELAGMQDIQVSYGGTTGTISNGSMSYEGGGLDSWEQRAKGSLGSSGGGMFSPGTAGQYGVYPAFLGDQFPAAAFANFDPISKAKYKFTDPMKYAQEFGAQNAETYRSNQKLGKEFALDQIDTELQGLQGYAPAAAALKQSLTSADNQFNQAQRTSMVDTALPGVRGSLVEQGKRAEAYANGRLPDSMQDRALELGVRSQAADAAAAGGFGATSSVARKASDLMSAERRIQLGMQGEQLLTSNIGTKANLQLAPTEYTDSGTQIRVNPTVDAGTRQAQQGAALNSATMIDPSTALSANIAQNEFVTNLAQRTKEFNASSSLQNSQFNANAANNFALGKFDYLTGYATSVADATQKDINTNVALDQQEQARLTAEQSKGEAQQGNTVSSVAGSVGAIAGVINGLTGDSSSTGSTIPSVTDVAGTDTPITNGTPDFSVDTSGSSDLPMPSVDNGIPEFNTGYTAIDTYANTAGISQETARSLTNPGQVVASTQAVMSNAGISSTPQSGYQPVGYGSSGKAVFMDSTLQNDATPYKAVQSLANLQTVLAPLQTDISADTVPNLVSKIADPELISDLNALRSTGDSVGFVDAVQKAFDKPGAQNAKGESLDTAFSSAGVYEHWDKMSPAQKYLALASIGTQGLRGKSGQPLAQVEIPISKMDGASPLKVKDALQIAALGYHPTEVALNWGDIDMTQRMLGVSGSLKQRLESAESLGLISRV